MIMAQTTEHLFLIHDGARYHTVPRPAFLAAHKARLTEYPLPSYSPDYNPIEYLWKKTKQRATHNKYFKEFAELTVSVEKALAYFATHPDTVLGLFGRYCEKAVWNSNRPPRLPKANLNIYSTHHHYVLTRKEMPSTAKHAG